MIALGSEVEARGRRRRRLGKQRRPQDPAGHLGGFAFDSGKSRQHDRAICCARISFNRAANSLGVRP
jgi:hypothetical protein